MRVVIDRFEDDFAVVILPDGKTADLPKMLVPEGAGEGAVIDITYNENETDERRGRIKSKMDRLFKK